MWRFLWGGGDGILATQRSTEERPPKFLGNFVTHAGHIEHTLPKSKLFEWVDESV